MKMKLTRYLLNFKLEKLSSAEPLTYGGSDYIACDTRKKTYLEENNNYGKKNNARRNLHRRP